MKKIDSWFGELLKKKEDPQYKKMKEYGCLSLDNIVSMYFLKPTSIKSKILCSEPGLAKRLQDAGWSGWSLKQSAFRKAAERGNMEMVKFFILGGINIHCNHEAALAWACEKGRREVAELLVRLGADPKEAMAWKWYFGREIKHLSASQGLLFEQN